MPTVQFSVPVRNAMLDSFENAVGPAPKLRYYSGAMPANCAAARTGQILCEITLPSDWAAAAANGSKLLAGTWTGVGTAAAGAEPGTTIGYFALMDSAGAVCHEQGLVGLTGDTTVVMTLDDITIVTGQAVNVTTWTHTAGNA